MRTRSALLHHAARRASRHPWAVRFTHLGFAVRGAMYVLMGGLALRAALGGGSGIVAPGGAIDLIGSEPAGRAALIVVVLGLAGYATWGFVRAVFDPLERGTSPRGLALRLGYLFSGFGYLALCAATLGLLAGGRARVEPAQDWTVSVLAEPFGRAVVAIVGLCWIVGSGLSQIVSAVTGRFARDLALDRRHARERIAAAVLARTGLAVRGAVFGVVGGLVVAAAVRGAGGATGLDAALAALLRPHNGRVLLAAAGVGFMAFGAYSALCARWMRVHRGPAGPG